ncbi:MAG: hypothetical protein WC686_01230 [Candidatus Shapirobacteria bacterium]|jgi:hypothetical protein
MNRLKDALGGGDFGKFVTAKGSLVVRVDNKAQESNASHPKMWSMLGVGPIEKLASPYSMDGIKAGIANKVDAGFVARVDDNTWRIMGRSDSLNWPPKAEPIVARIRRNTVAIFKSHFPDDDFKA